MFDRHSHISLLLAVAASRAAPGVYPPTTINDHRYIDGGIYSGTNADLARGYERVLILKASVADGSQRIPRVSFADELAALTGAQVRIVTPDKPSMIAKGPNPFDVHRRGVSAQAGRAQGLALAGNLKHSWHG